MLLTAAGGLFLLQWLLAPDVQKTCQVHSGSVSTDCEIPYAIAVLYSTV